MIDTVVLQSVKEVGLPAAPCLYTVYFREGLSLTQHSCGMSCVPYRLGWENADPEDIAALLIDTLRHADLDYSVRYDEDQNVIYLHWDLCEYLIQALPAQGVALKIFCCY